MGPLYSAIVAAVVGKMRKCAKCGRKQVVERTGKVARYHCRFCGHAFTKDELRNK